MARSLTAGLRAPDGLRMSGTGAPPQGRRTDPVRNRPHSSLRSCRASMAGLEGSAHKKFPDRVKRLFLGGAYASPGLAVSLSFL